MNGYRMNAYVDEILRQSYPLWATLATALTVAVIALLVILGQRRRYRQLQTSLSNQLQLRTASIQAQYEHATENLYKVEQQYESLQVRWEALQQQKSEIDIQFAQSKARWQEKEAAHAANLGLLQSAKESLTKEFENIANRLFEDKQEQFSRISTAQIEHVITPFHRQLQDFHQRVDDFHRQDIAHRHQLMGQISQLQQQSQQIGMDAVNLANALKSNNKSQGSWGELVLDRVLEQAGLVNGREFSTQVVYEGERGKRLQPDAVVHLPQKKQIIIDAKVSLVAYERYANAEGKEQQVLALKGHIDSVRSHIKNLASKRYEELMGVNTLDFVCLFLPIESAFVALAQNAPEVLQEAYEQKIVLVSPSSLLLVLKTVDCLWQRERQDRNVESIVTDAGKLYDQFVRFVESMQEMGACLDKAQTAHQKAFARLVGGRGNLVKRAEDLKHLGAKTARKLPADLVRDARQNDSDQYSEVNV